MEIHKQINEINNRLEECEALQQLNDGHINVMNALKNENSEKNNLSGNSTELKNLLGEFETALKAHNNTIKTHFKLNDAYNMAVIDRIEKEMGNLNKMNEKVITETKQENFFSQDSLSHNSM